ncbi:hypothetical protein L2E82_09410 [Cichorium intybus]|uniref:Uncharacterized protein n=1 Tax=Cichorium intybus TaxID=13427 RepID=A0ACB9G8C8_CICIN|nr:hypothetical protein L2E82_09410 [Cichorium intybus]
MALGATCVQKLDGSRDSAIHTKYRILLRSSSMREPRYPLPRVVCDSKEATTNMHTANGTKLDGSFSFVVFLGTYRAGVHVHGSFCFAGFDNDPSAGSPTETLLRLLLPLNDKLFVFHKSKNFTSDYEIQMPPTVPVNHYSDPEGQPGITAAAGTRLALQWILVKGFRLYSFQLPDSFEPGIVIYCHYLPVSGLGNLRACCLPWMWINQVAFLFDAAHHARTCRCMTDGRLEKREHSTRAKIESIKTLQPTSRSVSKKPNDAPRAMPSLHRQQQYGPWRALQGNPPDTQGKLSLVALLKRYARVEVAAQADIQPPVTNQTPLMHLYGRHPRRPSS